MFEGNSSWDGPGIFLFDCPKCQAAHWVPEDLIQMSSSGERLDKIEMLHAAGDIGDKDYEHWKHIVIAYAVHLGVERYRDIGGSPSVHTSKR